MDFVPQVEIDRQLPDAESDNTQGSIRGGRYREQYNIPIYPFPTALSDEGTYIIGTSPTPGTGIPFVVNTGVSEIAGNFIYLKNNDAPENSRVKRVYPHYLRLICTAPPAAGISGHYLLKVDNKDRYTSGGSSISPVNCNISGGTGTVAQLYAGALTTISPSPSARLLSRGVMRSLIPVINDEWMFSFGCADAPGAGSLGGTIAQRMPIPVPPIILGPQANMCLQLWFPSNAVTPPSFEFEFGWFER